MRASRGLLFCLIVMSFAAQAFAICEGPAIVAPGNGAPSVPQNTAGTVILKWGPTAGPSGAPTAFDVFFGAPGQGCTAAPVATVTEREFAPQDVDVQSGTTYEWKVRAMGTGCPGQVESSCATFTTAACPTVGPVLSAPANASQVAFGNITLQWAAAADASFYEVFAGLDGGTAGRIATTSQLQTSILVQPGRTVEWNVVAMSAGCTGAASSPFTFTTTCPTGAPVLRSPGNGTVFPANSAITFTWEGVPGATSYDVKVSPSAQNQWVVIGENINGSSFSKVFDQQGNFDWEVRANFDGSCAPAFSTTGTFSVGPACASEAPALLSPADGATTATPVTFEWSDVKAAVYRLFVQKEGDRTPTLLTNTTRTEHAASLEAGKWQWSVVAVFDGCPDMASVINNLTIEGSSTGCPTNPGQAELLSPAADATGLSSPVTFSWKPVDGAANYRVLAAFGAIGEVVSLGLTKATTLTADVPAGKGGWQVQTLFGPDCPETLSERRNFTVTSGAACNDAPPTLLFPPNAATGVASPVEFRWSAVADATKYQLFAALGDDDFSFYGVTDEPSFERFVPPGVRIRWFVIAELPACPDLRSTVSTFETAESTCDESATITLTSPAEASTVTSPVRLAWSAVTGAEFYRIWVSVDGEAPAIVARIPKESTETTLPLPSGKIVWYVDAPRGNCQPVVSDEGSFTVSEGANCGTNQAPVLVSPAGPESDPADATSPVTLIWNAATNAIGYRVWVAEKNEAFEDVDLTKETRTQLDLEPGVYKWFVQAIFNGCEPEPSTIAFFEIASTTPRCPTEAPTILTPANGSVTNSPVTFTWTAVADAEKYRLFVSREGGPPIPLGATTDTTLEEALPPGQYVAAVEAVFDECPSIVSARVTFTVPESQNCSTGEAELVSPADGAADVTSPVDFIWSPVSGAVKYVLVLQAGDGAPTPIETTEDTQFSEDLPPGRYAWWVRTFFSGCDPTESEHNRFVVPRPQNDCGKKSPILLLPEESPAVAAPVSFIWTPVPSATGYNVWVAEAGSRDFSIVARTTGEFEASVDLPVGRYRWFVEATFEGCLSTRSGDGEFTVSADVPCGRPDQPTAQAIGQAQSNSRYRVIWTPVPNAGFYELQESTTADFANAETITVEGNAHVFVHQITGSPVQYLYRVRAVSKCNDERGPYSDVIGVFVIAPKSSNASAEFGTAEGIVQTITLPPSNPPQNFAATADKPWVTITPASGVVGAEGATLTLTANPAVLYLGTNSVTVSIVYTSIGNGPQTHAGSTTIPISISLVTPVIPSGKSSPPPDSLIFPAVGHAVGANDSLFESDIRITNLTAQTMKYQLLFTPSGVDGTQTGSTSNIELSPNQTMAMDDIVASLFGTGTTSSATGMLEVRPLTSASSSSSSFFTTVTQNAIKQLDTAASSRTYNFTSNGTFGQFIPAIRFDEFVGKAATGSPASILSLQQVAQSSAYRANFGFVEGSGQPVDLVVRVYDVASTLLATIPVSLKASEHKQINGMLSLNGINNLTDGRVEVEVVNGTGKVSAYVSEVDNRTNDPLLVSGVLKGSTTANRYVVPGMAYINTGSAFWVSDLRIFNAGTTATPATLTFHPQGNPSASLTREITLNPGEVEVLDNVVGALFAQPTGTGGSIVVTTPANTQLTASARTYNQTSNGTYGQFIPGVTVAQSVGVADRALQILQLEQSPRFRTNIGLNETSGQPATVEVSLIVPDSLATPVVTIPLAANEFKQISLFDFVGTTGVVYNGRVTVKVISGTGRVTAYGSAIDSITQDPTYVPAQ